MLPRSSLAFPLAALALVACGSSNPEPATPDPNAPCPPGQYCPPPAASLTATAPAPTTTAPAPTATATSASATPVPPLGAAAVQPILTAMGQSEVPGMKPDGAAFAGSFQEGQTLEQPFNIQAGKCYSVIAAAVGAIAELDIQIVFQAMPNMPPVVLAQDNSTGSAATLGGKGNCWRNPTPLAGPGKVILKATKGSGLAAGQIFIK